MIAQLSQLVVRILLVLGTDFVVTLHTLDQLDSSVWQRNSTVETALGFLGPLMPLLKADVSYGAFIKSNSIVKMVVPMQHTSLEKSNLKLN